MKLMSAVAVVGALLTNPVTAQQPGGRQSQPVTATGLVKKVDSAKHILNLSHGPIPATS